MDHRSGLSFISCAAALMSVVSASSLAFAQGVTVPWSECYSDCAHPHDVDPCCSPNWPASTCTRFDSLPVVVYPGTRVVLPGVGFVFACSNCCKFDPAECPGNDYVENPKHCSLGSSLTFIESISISIDSSVSVGVGSVELKLEAGVGVVKGHEARAELNCPMEVPKCYDVACTPEIVYMAGRTARVDHTWMASGTWINYDGVGCKGASCAIAGNAWIVPTGSCWQTSSYATGDQLISAKCGSSFVIKCPDPDPCNE